MKHNVALGNNCTEVLDDVNIYILLENKFDKKSPNIDLDKSQTIFISNKSINNQLG